MLYSTRSSIFDYDLVYPQSHGSPVFGSVEQLISEVTKYDDRITELIKLSEPELMSGKIRVMSKLSNTWPTFFFILTNSGPGLQLNIDSHGMFVRELVASISVSYPWLLNVLERKTKDIALVPFVSGTLSKLMYTINRRPVQEDVFFSRCVVYMVGHYLRLYGDRVPNKSTFHREVSKCITVTRVVEEEISQYFSKNIELLEREDYNGRLFLRSLCDNVLNSTYDLVLSQLISKFGTNVCVALDEPSYFVFDIVTGKLFKVNMLHNYVQPGVLSRMLSYVLTHLRKR